MSVNKIYAGGLSMPMCVYTTAINTLLSTDNPPGAPGAHHARSSGKWILAANASPIYYPIHLQTGDTITGYAIDINKGDTGHAITACIVTVDDSGDHVQSAGSTSSLGTGLQLMAESGLTIVSAGAQYCLRITPGGTASPASDVVIGVRV